METPTELRQRITDEIVASIGQGRMPWRQPWSRIVRGLPCHFHHKRAYSGVNPLILFLRGYASPYWGTLPSWKRYLKVEVRSEAKPTEIVFFAFIPKKDKSGKVERIAGGMPKLVPVLRTYAVYNAEQMVGLTDEAVEKLAKLTTTMVVANSDPDFEPAENLIVSSQAHIVSGDAARYVESEDRIILPSKGQFDTVGNYYDTAFHELMHWTMNTGRVGRKKGYEGNYAFGELAAEIGACYMCAHLRVPHAEQMLEHSKSYIGAWLDNMGRDTRFIFEAAAHASKLNDYLLTLSRTAAKAA